MSKNILIFSDGTGQSGGRFFDESRTNIYKLYRATRCGPDSPIDPTKQLTYYNRGIGTDPAGTIWPPKPIRRLWDLIRQATGWGFTSNLIDCYAAVIQMWRPGDRIFLFGFSRGAYTVRCLGTVISLCGVPTRSKDGSPLELDDASTTQIAKEAVRKVFEATLSKNENSKERRALAVLFRNSYRSNGNTQEEPNAIPYFIGVFDTVAAIANHPWIVGLGITLLVALGAYLVSLFGLSFWPVFLVSLALAMTPYLKTLKLSYYDHNLNPQVHYARHALSIDEDRSDFSIVPWGTVKTIYEVDKNKKNAFEQVWFAGNHSDVGGGYPENEARLSDIALQWMASSAKGAVDGIQIDESMLQVHPSPGGKQHDEMKSSIFKYISKKKLRTVPEHDVLDASVSERFALPEVLQYDLFKPYRPQNLRSRSEFKAFYSES